MILEQRGVSSSMNGLNAAALYLGILVITPFCSRLVCRWGYRDMILIGLGSQLFVLCYSLYLQAFMFGLSCGF